MYKYMGVYMYTYIIYRDSERDREGERKRKEIILMCIHLLLYWKLMIAMF